MTLYQGKYRIETTRHPLRDYRSRGSYFVTICTHYKAHIFGDVHDSEVQLSTLGRIADAELRTLASHYQNVTIDSYIVMPNHVHAIIVIEGDHQFSPNAKPLPTLKGFSPAVGSLGAIVRSYKSGVTRRSHALGFASDVWQSRFYDEILRGDAVISAVRQYIEDNPANWNKDPDRFVET